MPQVQLSAVSKVLTLHEHSSQGSKELSEWISIGFLEVKEYETNQPDSSRLVRFVERVGVECRWLNWCGRWNTGREEKGKWESSVIVVANDAPWRKSPGFAVAIFRMPGPRSVFSRKQVDIEAVCEGSIADESTTDFDRFSRTPIGMGSFMPATHRPDDNDPFRPSTLTP